MEKLREYAHQLGRMPTIEEWELYAQKNDVHSSTWICMKFGKRWNELAKEIGVIPAKNRFTKEECLQALLECAKDCGPKFTVEQYKEWRKSHPEYPSIWAIRRRLGTELADIRKKLVAPTAREAKEYIGIKELAEMLDFSYYYVQSKAKETLLPDYNGVFLRPDRWKRDKKGRLYKPEWEINRAKEFVKLYVRKRKSKYEDEKECLDDFKKNIKFFLEKYGRVPSIHEYQYLDFKPFISTLRKFGYTYQKALFKTGFIQELKKRNKSKEEILNQFKENILSLKGRIPTSSEYLALRFSPNITMLGRYNFTFKGALESIYLDLRWIQCPYCRTKYIPFLTENCPDCGIKNENYTPKEMKRCLTCGGLFFPISEDQENCKTNC